MTNAQKIIIVIVLLAVLGGLGYGLSKKLLREEPTVSEGPVAKVFTYEGDNPPPSFPRELLISERGETVQNYEAVTNDGRFKQSTYAFASSKSLEELYELYTGKLKELGWEVKAGLDQPSLKAISASKASASVSISISSNASTGKNSVVISYIEPASN